MGYKAPGFHKRSEGRLILEAAALLQSRFANNAEKLIKELFEPMAPQGTRARTVTFEMLLQSTAESFSGSSPTRLAWLHILSRIWAHAGWGTVVPERPYYQPRAVLTIDESIDEMLSHLIVWPDAAALGGADTQMFAMRAFLPRIIEDIASVQYLRPKLLKDLRTMVGHVAWKIRRGMPIDQSERTLFVLYNNTSKVKDPLENPGSSILDTSDVPPIPIAEHADPRVDSTFELYKRSVEVGPSFRFTRILSNRDRLQLIAWHGPIVNSLPIRVGEASDFGPFVELDLEDLDTIAWGPASQFDGIIESGMATLVQSDFSTKIFKNDVAVDASPASALLSAYTRVPAPQIFRRPSGNTTANEHTAFLDHPDIQLLISPSKDAFANDFQWRYVSQFLVPGTTLSSGENGADIDTVLTDICLRYPTFGEGRVGNLTVDSWPVLDLTELSQDAKANPDRRIIRDEDFLETVYFPNAAQTDLETRVVDMKAFYRRSSQTLVLKPAFVEYVQPTIADLTGFVDRAAVQEIIAQLALPPSRQRICRRAIEISHSYARMRRYLGREPLVGKSIKEFIRAITPGLPNTTLDGVIS